MYGYESVSQSQTPVDKTKQNCRSDKLLSKFTRGLQSCVSGPHLQNTAIRIKLNYMSDCFAYIYSIFFISGRLEKQRKVSITCSCAMAEKGIIISCKCNWRILGCGRGDNNVTNIPLFPYFPNHTKG